MVKGLYKPPVAIPYSTLVKWVQIGTIYSFFLCLIRPKNERLGDCLEIVHVSQLQLTDKQAIHCTLHL